MSHEAQLLEVLQKVGQLTPAESQGDSAVLDAEDKQTAETGGSPPVKPDKPHIDLAPITRRNFFAHHDAHPVVFDIVLLRQYGAEWFTWDPETLWKELKDDFRFPSISDHTKAKIQAIKTLHINEWFWTKWEVFCWITQALNNNIPDFHVIQKPSASQLFNAVDIATMVRNDEEFSQEVQGWVAASIVEEGIFYAPDPIGFSQDEVLELLGELKVEEPQQMITAVQERYREVQKLSDAAWAAAPGPILKETAVDIQVAKLKVACDYLSLRRRQLQDQLRLFQ